MRAVVIALVLVLVSSSARADDTKSPGWALTASVGGTVGGVLLFGAFASDSEASGSQLATGAFLFLTGPSWGHVYAGDYDLAIGGTLLRVAGFVMIAEGQGRCVPNDDPNGSLDDCEHENPMPALAAVGGILVLGTALAEIIDAPFAAKRYNREHALSVTPITTASRGYGLALSGTF